MDKNKLLNELKKMLSDKKISNILALLLILVFVLIAYNVFVPKSTSEKKQTNEDKYNNEYVENVGTKAYEEKEREDLVSILEQIEGVGKVQVKINFESDEVKVPAYESTTQTSTTEEADNVGGTRVNEQTNETTSVVKSDDEPYILQTNKPKVIGITVAAEGASDVKVKSDIEKAVCSLYDLPINKVNVYPKAK